ncbi:hypothetical protein niasHT_040125 [Heterodera trifolii]|uniref:Peptidase A2 domain-containing protein n=1 Tax=Heterodera trifolii TaxID=157864 RepID=A0ABD2HRW7_9BILA
MIKLQLAKKATDFELDCGADVTLISKDDWMSIGKPKLGQTSGLMAYGKKPIKVLGSFKTDVVYNGKKANAEIYVVDGKGKNLCGRDLIGELQIDLNKAFGIRSVNEVNSKAVNRELGALGKSNTGKSDTGKSDTGKSDTSGKSETAGKSDTNFKF